MKRQSGNTPRTRWLIACVVAAVGGFLMFAASAGAVTYTTGTSIPTGGNIYGADDVAVDQTTGDLYVADKYHSIAHFSQAGTLLNTWEEPQELEPVGVAYDPALNVIYAAMYGVGGPPDFLTFYEIRAYEDDGTEIHIDGFPITMPFATRASTFFNLELDPNGDIYFANRESTVYKFDHETGATLKTLTCADCPGRANFEEPTSVGVDSNGFIYVPDHGSEEHNEKGRVVKLNPDGSFNSVLTEYEPVPGGLNSNGLAIGVDPTTNDVFLGTGSGSAYHIRAFNAVGEEFADFGAGTITEPAFASENQIGVYGATGTVYVSDSSGAGVLRDYTPDPELLAETLNAEVETVGSGSSSATVDGIVNPNGKQTTECAVEYGTSTSYGESAPCETSPGNASIRTPVLADLSGLERGVEYHYKVVEKTAAGTASGGDRTFTTPPPAAPLAKTGTASGISQTVATLGGKVNPMSGVTTCKFEYGTTTSYGTSVSCTKLPGSGSEEVAVSAALSGLSANTTYHFRLVAANAGGPANGSDGTFTTLVDTCQTKASLCPPAPKPTEKEPEGNNNGTYGACVAAANKAYKAALKKAKSKHGKAHAKAMVAAKEHKTKAVSQCKKRFH